MRLVPLVSEAAGSSGLWLQVSVPLHRLLRCEESRLECFRISIESLILAQNTGFSCPSKNCSSDGASGALQEKLEGNNSIARPKNSTRTCSYTLLTTFDIASVFSSVVTTFVPFVDLVLLVLSDG